MTYIHPTALIEPNVIIEDNVYIGPYCIIGFPPEWKKREEEGNTLPQLVKEHWYIEFK
jgi:acetyltransferase-like isoleucine patch superfamily enzyme